MSVAFERFYAAKDVIAAWLEIGIAEVGTERINHVKVRIDELEFG